MFKHDDDPAFAGQVAYSGTKRNNDPIDRLESQEITTRVAPNQLDDEYHKGLFNKLIGFYRAELMRQEDNREQQSIDADFVDGLQWTPAQAQEIRDRGQEPLVYNVIATTYQWLLGTEKRGRTDYKILPRLKEASKAAEKKSQLLKYLSDVNRSEFAISLSFADTAKVGVGWLEAGVQSDDEGEPIYDRRESWRNMLWDSVAIELDLCDARYMFRSQWTDTDIAKSMFPKRQDIINLAANKTFDIFRALDGTGDEAMDAAEEHYQQNASLMLGTEEPDRSRVRLIEVWFRAPSNDQYMSGGQFRGELFDPQSEGHMREVESGRAKVQPRVRMRMFTAIMTEAGLCHLSKSPYRHNQYPFTPIWAYRRDRDNLPYGPIRHMRDPQSDINKRASKALHILSTNKTIMDKGAVDDLKEFADEVSRPDAIIVKNPNKHLELNADRELAAGHLDLMSRSIGMIQQVGGVTDENMGRTTNATSGKAIVARQDQGALATATIFDNLRFARQVHGEKMLSLTEQFMDQEKQFRITNMRGNAEWVTVNDGMPENDIIASKADFIISEDDWNATMRQAQVESLIELMQMLAGTAPQIVMATLDLLVETMDVPQREELVKRIRQITGAEDPDADPDHPDPETAARKEAQSVEMELMQRMKVAEVSEKEASAAEKQAKAMKAQGEAQRVVAEVQRILAETAGTKVETQVQALQAAAQILGAPAIAGVADAVLVESGFEGAGAPAPAPETMPAQQPVPALPAPTEQLPPQEGMA